MKRLIGIVVCVLLVLAVIFSEPRGVRPGVKLDGVPVGGFTLTQVRKVAYGRAEMRLDLPLTLHIGNSSFHTTLRKLGVRATPPAQGYAPIWFCPDLAASKAYIQWRGAFNGAQD